MTKSLSSMGGADAIIICTLLVILFHNYYVNAAPSTFSSTIHHGELSKVDRRPTYAAYSSGGGILAINAAAAYSDNPGTATRKEYEEASNNGNAYPNDNVANSDSNNAAAAATGETNNGNQNYPGTESGNSNAAAAGQGISNNGGDSSVVAGEGDQNQAGGANNNNWINNILQGKNGLSVLVLLVVLVLLFVLALSFGWTVRFCWCTFYPPAFAPAETASANELAVAAGSAPLMVDANNSTLFLQL